MGMASKMDRNRRILKQWRTGRYKHYASLARIFRVDTKIVQRVVTEYADEIMAMEKGS